MTRGRVLTVVVVLAIGIAASGIAQAESSLPWTPRAMRTALLKPKVEQHLFGEIKSQVRNDLHLALIRIKHVSSCKGLGPRKKGGSRKKGGYSLFTCQITWVDHLCPRCEDSPPTTAPLWVRPWSSRKGTYYLDGKRRTGTWICIADLSAGTCPPPEPRHMLPGDPRAYYPGCSGDGAYPTCVAAYASHLANPAFPMVCVAGAIWTNYNCTEQGGGSGKARVKFIRHPHRWTTNVTRQTG